MMQDYDVIVVGGGPAGLSLTAMLAAHQLRTLCLDRDAPATQLRPAFDGRTTALAAAATESLAAVGAWEELKVQACPIHTIRVTDQGASRLLHFDDREVGQPFGWIVENRDLRRALQHRVAALPAATLASTMAVQAITPDAHGVTVTAQHGKQTKNFRAQLVVGADGRASFCRNWVGIDWLGHDYWQSAVVCTVRHSLPHNHSAVEDFLPHGPLAALPMTGQRSSIVWTHTHAAAAVLRDMDAATFCAQLERHLSHLLGTIALEGERFLYPLGIHHASRYTAQRLVLVGEAAHAMHPIAGQGFNISMRDNQCLAAMLLQARSLGLDLGNATLLARYSRTRRSDTMAMLAATDGLDRFFSNAVPGLGLLRQFGLATVNRIPPLKRFFMQTAMGHATLQRRSG